jgi:hypothetical protein
MKRRRTVAASILVVLGCLYSMTSNMLTNRTHDTQQKKMAIEIDGLAHKLANLQNTRMASTQPAAAHVEGAATIAAIVAKPIRATGLDPGLYSPTGYQNVDSYPNANKYPAKLTFVKQMAWDNIMLPAKLPIHGLRIVNRMPQLGVVVELDKVQVASGGTKFTFTTDSIGADELAHTKYSQMYDPSLPYSVETGAMTEVPGNCFMTMPKNGPKVFTVEYKDGSTGTIAIVPMLGPYGNEPRFGCFPKTISDAYALKGFSALDEVGVPDTSGFLMSFKPEAGVSDLVWDQGSVSAFVSMSANRENNQGNYEDGHGRLYNVFKHYPPKGLKCLVVGSAPNPWVEGILLDHGALHVTTSEYQVPELRDLSDEYKNRMTSIHHEKLLANPVLFDMIVSFSSLEHDGLGRYHDPMSPAADLQQMRNLHDMLKLGGKMIVEVPMANPHDEVIIPYHRLYGPTRYPLFTEPFRLLGMYFSFDPVVCVSEESGVGGCNKMQTVVEAIRLEAAEHKKGCNAAEGRPCAAALSVLVRYK